MRSKTIYKLAGILGVLLILIGIKNYWPRFKTEPSYYQKRVKNIKKENLAQIEISQKGKKIVFKKEQGEWMINSKKADKEKINRLLTSLLDGKNEQIAQTDRKHKEFELKKESAKQLKIGRTTFFIGKSTIGGVYMRFSDDDKVFLNNDLSLSDVSTDVNDWYDKTIVQINEKSIKELSFLFGSKNINLIKDDKNNWKIKDEDKKLEKSKVTEILSSLSLLKATSLASKEDLFKYPDKEFELTITFDDSVETLKFYKGEKDYLVRRNSDNEIFILDEFQVKPFTVFKL